MRVRTLSLSPGVLVQGVCGLGVPQLHCPLQPVPRVAPCEVFAILEIVQTEDIVDKTAVKAKMPCVIYLSMLFPLCLCSALHSRCQGGVLDADCTNELS